MIVITSSQSTYYSNKLVMIDKIEQQFAQKFIKQGDQDQDQQSTRKSLYRENHLSRKAGGIDFGQPKDKNDHSLGLSNANENMMPNMAPSIFDDDDFVSVPRSKSLSNNRSRSSFNMNEGCSNDYIQSQQMT